MTEQKPVAVVSIVGRSGAGKTTLIEKLIPLLIERGYRVGTVKHHAHAGFEIDQPGKDSWRHAQAGSSHVVLVASDKIATIRLLEHEPPLEEIASAMTDVDIVLTEGFRREGIQKIEVARAELSRVLLCEPHELVAVAADFDLQIGVPRLDLNDAVSVVDLIEEKFLCRTPAVS